MTYADRVGQKGSLGADKDVVICHYLLEQEHTKIENQEFSPKKLAFLLHLGAVLV